VVRGWALASGRRAAEGIAEIRRGLADYTATGAAMWVPYFLGLLAEAHGHAGEVAEGLALVSDALAQTERMGTRWIKSELHRLRGELLLARHQAERREAEACLRRALAVAAQQGAKHWELRAATSLARLLHGQGRDTEASAALGAILRCYAPGLDLPDLGDAEAALGPSR
jgi:predicted ATPase